MKDKLYRDFHQRETVVGAVAMKYAYSMFHKYFTLVLMIL